ncbi:hypothetical protein RJ55_07724 [Drechmeria coniospora]|nr:hypothetical protein RJ55_07724 [Drechmeria coniospora]
MRVHIRTRSKKLRSPAEMRGIVGALLLSFLPRLVDAAPSHCGSRSVPAVELRTDYDVIVVGGGPSGLAALSALGRVRRRALLVDSGEYRNAPTRHMHDVPGFDGIPPALYRWAAMQQISHYETAHAINGTVTHVDAESNKGCSYFTVTMDIRNGTITSKTARKVILGTGLRDLLPDTPGLRESFGQGIYWCPWCDGMEHADQSMGVLGSFEKAVVAVAEIITLNTDVVVLANGTVTNEARAKAEEEFAPNSEAYLGDHGVRVDNRTISRIVRLKHGADEKRSTRPTAPEHDLFRIDFDDGSSIERQVLFANYPSEQQSAVGQQAGVDMRAGRMAVDSNMLTSIPGIYAVGDANSDNSTNVLHALYTGKRAVVHLHVDLERELSGTLRKRSSQSDAEEMRKIWARVNGEPGQPLYAGEYR